MTSLISGLAKLDPIGSKILGFDQPKAQTATTVVTPAPPSASTTDQAANVQAQADQLRQRQGRAANVLTSDQGVNSTPTGTKTLLGQ